MLTETITLEGHIIDSRALGNVLDDILALGGEFKILEVAIGQSKYERSHARIEVRAKSRKALRDLRRRLSQHGALWDAPDDAELTPADMDGAFPDDFYCTTNQQTWVRHGGEWQEVRGQEMDCGIRRDPPTGEFRCLPMNQVHKGDLIVCGHRGVRLELHDRQRASGAFEFMTSEVSTEKPKNTIIRRCAGMMIHARDAGQKLLLVGGPAIVHTGASEHVTRLIERGFVHVLFAGNALAVHDIEHSLYGTSLGVYIDKATLADTGHEHHLRAINTIRRAGGIAAAVERGLLKSGVMHACVKHGVEFVLAGSVRDDGPLPDVITDVMVAQDRMRTLVRDVGFVLMVATALHSIATGNLLPAWTPVVCVDISPSMLTKLSDRGSSQTVGLVTDVEPFFRSLAQAIDELDSASPTL